MNPYHVRWANRPLDQLADIWVARPDLRDSVERAVLRIESTLRSYAPFQGQDIHEGLRRLIEPPLHVIFEVDEAKSIAEIVAARLV